MICSKRPLPWAVGWWRGDGFARAIAAINGAQWYAGGLLQLFVVLVDTHRWSGWPSFGVGIALLHLGILVSGIKGGAHRRLLLRFLGPASEPSPP